MITNLTGTPVASLLEPNGDILVRLFNGTTATVARFLPSGALDTSFGSGGVAQTAISGSAELPLDGSGKVLVGSGTGSTSNTLAFVVERLNPNGQPDPTFGSNGVASANSSGKSATCLLVQPDGKVLIGGDRIQTGRPEKEFGLIMRFNSDGTLDTAFGNAGQVNLSSNGTGVDALGLDASGDIFALGAGPQTELSPAGQVDANLTPAPLTTISKGDHLLAGSLTANDQSLLRETVHTGGRGASQSFEAQIARRTATGALDPTFSSTPFRFTGQTSLLGADLISEALTAPRGKIVAVGASHPQNESTAGVIGVERLDANGQPDTTFGNPGGVTTSISQNSAADTGIVQPNGDIVVAGTADNGGAAQVVLIRYRG